MPAILTSTGISLNETNKSLERIADTLGGTQPTGYGTVYYETVSQDGGNAASDTWITRPLNKSSGTVVLDLTENKFRVATGVYLFMCDCSIYRGDGVKVRCVVDGSPVDSLSIALLNNVVTGVVASFSGFLSVANTQQISIETYQANGGQMGYSPTYSGDGTLFVFTVVNLLKIG